MTSIKLIYYRLKPGCKLIVMNTDPREPLPAGCII